MIHVAKIKKTGEVVSIVGEFERGYKTVVRKLDTPNRSGHWGETFNVKNENLSIEQQEEAIVSSE